MYGWLQVQEGVDLKASDLVRFVLQTDTRSRERQAARIERLKVAPPHPHDMPFICTALKKMLFCLYIYEVEGAWLYSYFGCQECIHIMYGRGTSHTSLRACAV